MTPDEIKQTASLLGKLTPGFLPLPIFEQIARIVALPIVELIPLQKQGEEVSVLLLQRPPDDPLWAGMWHTPGTVLRATDLYTSDDTYWSPFRRLVHDELKDTQIGKPFFVGSMLHESKRGVEQAQIYWTEVVGEPKAGTLFASSQLPENVIASQRTFIEEAVASFRRNHYGNHQ